MAFNPNNYDIVQDLDNTAQDHVDCVKNTKGGTSNQILKKNSNTDYDFEWEDLKATTKYDDISSAQSDLTLASGDIVFVEGYGSNGDGGQHYRIVGSSDDGSNIPLSNGLFLNYIEQGVPNVKWFGAVADNGVTDNLSSFTKAQNVLKERYIYMPEGRFSVSSVATLDIERFYGDGQLTTTVTGGQRKHNTYADTNKYVFGIEYLYAFQQLLIDQQASPTRKPIAIWSGDSTTNGSDVAVEYRIYNMFKEYMEKEGMQTPYNITSINGGHGGEYSGEWLDNHLANDLAQNPDLYVLRWGINDPTRDNTGAGVPSENQDDPLRRTPDDFIATMRQGLTTIRASRGVESLSILLMSPNSTYDVPRWRDATWYEEAVPKLKDLAREFQCTFIDTFAYVRDSENAGNVWMDKPYATGGGIHPKEVMNSWIMDLVCKTICPTGLKHRIGRTNFQNISGVDDGGDASRTPDFYEYGLTLGRAAVGGGFPVDGAIETIRTSDNIVKQTLFPYSISDSVSYFVRTGRAADIGGEGVIFNNWIEVKEVENSSEFCTTNLPFNIPAGEKPKTTKNSNIVVCEGYINQATPAIVTTGTVVGNVHPDYRPINGTNYFVAPIFDGASNFSTMLMEIRTNGDIAAREDSPINIGRIWLNTSYSVI